MGYDDELAARVGTHLELLGSEVLVEERRMFGGLSFLVDGNLAVTVSGQGGMLVRVGATQAGAMIELGPAELAVMGKRVMRQWVRVAVEHVVSDEVLQTWVDHGVEFARSLPPKR